jgi:hypothetical protein
MARQVANVDILTDTFEIWVLQTNELLNALSTEIITANSAVGVTGNTTHPRKARLIGDFSSNVMVVTNELRGGNISSTGGTYANLNISTNTIISNATSTDLILRVANSSQSANLTPIDLKIGISTVNTITISVGSNLIANATTLFIGNTTSNSVTDRFGISSANSTTNLVANLNGVFIGNSTVNTNLTTSSLTVANSTQSTVANLSGVYVGNSYLTNTQFKVFDYFVDVSVNTDIGSTTATPVKVYEFPVADYSSGKFEVQVKKGSNTQISELVLAHNTTTAYVSVYGTVASPPNANGSVSPLGTFTANINSGNVHLLLTPTIANSAVKVIAHLIK